MKQHKLNYCFTMMVILLMMLNISEAKSQFAQCDYFGLKTPGTTPQEFNPSVLNLKGFIFNGAFSPKCDEFYFTRVNSKENIYRSKKVNGAWQSPEVVSFSDRNFNDADPFFDPRGKRVYFISTRPIGASQQSNVYNIWYAERKGDDWSKPVALPSPINTENNEYFFSVSNKGNAFFASNRAGGKGSFDFYQLKVSKNGKMSKPQNMGNPISTKGYEFDPHISLDESFMVYSVNDDQGASDLYFSYKDNKGNWTKGISLGDQVNVSRADFAPSLTPDNRYIIYTNNGKLMWVSVDLLESLK